MSSICKIDELSKMLHSINDFECCNYCNNIKLVLKCDSCRKYVCTNKECSELYPHHNNTIFTICRNCFDTIGNNIHLQLDYSKISSIKKKVLAKRTYMTDCV